jgi:predicted proteasome-type protease
VTLIVGLLCRDGVVVASDSAATFGTSAAPTIGQQAVQKVRRLNENLIYASTGAVGIAQIVADKLKSLWDAKALSGAGTPEAAMDKIGKEITQLVGPYLHTAQMQRALTGDASTSLCKSLLAIPVGQVPCLFQFDCNGAPERATPDLPFVALGIGQPIADPFLALLKRLLWPNEEPSLAEGRLAAVWAIDHVRRTNPGGVGGEIQLACLVPKPGKMPSVSVATEQDINEHLQKVALTEAALVEQVRGPLSVSEVQLPPAP